MAAEAGMVHLRLIVPDAAVEQVLAVLGESPAVVNVVRLAGCSRGLG